LAAVKLTTVQVTNLQLQHKINWHELLCKAWTDRGLVYIVKGRIFNIMLYRYVPSTFIRDKAILSAESVLHTDYDSKSSVWGGTGRKLVTN
jgi:hypothetical protein